MWRTGPDALPHLPMPPGYLPFLHCHLIFYFFSTFCIQYISVSLPTTSTRSRQHIPLSFCLLPELYAFIIFSFEVFLFFRKPSHLLPAPAGRHFTRSILTHPIHKPESRAPACRLHASRIFFVQSNLSLSSAVTLSSGASLPSSYPQHSYQSTCQSLAFRLAGYNTSRTFFIQSNLSLSSAITHSSGASRLSFRPQHSYPSTGQSHAFRLCRPHPHHISHILSVKAFSAFHQPSHFLPASAGRHLTRSILITQKPFHPHPASPASTTPPAPNQLLTLPPDALRHLPMPPGYLLSPPLCRSLLLLQYPIFSFFFLLNSSIAK